MGYPVVEVRRIDDKKVELRQKRFKWDENALEREKFRNARFWLVNLKCKLTNFHFFIEKI